MAAVLACGRGAVLSHRSAAALWAITPPGAGAIDVTVPRRAGSARPGIKIHRVRRLDRRDIAARDGVPVTTVARTLLDLAEVIRPDGLRRAFETTERLRLLDLAEIRRACERARGRRGLRPTLALLRSLRPAPETRSELERRFLDFCDRFALPPPSVNGTVEGLEVDAQWPGPRLAVELDGYEFHRTRAAFERDRARDATLQLAGYRVVRLTYRRLTDEPEEVARALLRLLE
ncbi:MAG: DUF559 domain-containing protein [Solirubrobacterales bacterium]